MKNKRHSDAVKILKKVRDLHTAYQKDVELTKNSLSTAIFNHDSNYKIRHYRMELDDCRYIC